MRTVKIINVRTSQPVLVASDATTFGQLKTQLGNISELGNIDFKNSKCIVRDKSISDLTASRKSIALDHEILPAGEFNLYISPMKVSQGGCNGGKVNNLVDFMRNIEALVEALAEVKEEIDAIVEAYDEDENIVEDVIEAVEELDSDGTVTGQASANGLDSSEEEDIEFMNNI